MANSYNTQYDRWIGKSLPVVSARLAKAVTPSNSKDLTDATGDAMSFYARSLYVGATGDLKVIMAASKDDAVTVTYVGVPAGALLPIQVRRVLSTGTTATSIVALFDD